MHQHVQPHRFLTLHGERDLRLHRRLVGRLVEPALPVILARPANLGGLREGADGGGREQRQAKAGALRLGAGRIRMQAIALRRRQCGQPRLHLGVSDAG